MEGSSEFGPVADGESLVRVIITPIHINQKTGDPTPAAFQTADLMDRGLSLLRSAYLNKKELEKQGQKLCKGREDRSVQGYMVGEAALVRALRDNADRKAFCVVDDTIPDQEMHATLMRSADQDELEIKALRRKLMSIFAPMRSAVSEVVSTA